MMKPLRHLLSWAWFGIGMAVTALTMAVVVCLPIIILNLIDAPVYAQCLGAIAWWCLLALFGWLLAVPKAVEELFDDTSE